MSKEDSGDGRALAAAPSSPQAVSPLRAAIPVAAVQEEILGWIETDGMRDDSRRLLWLARQAVADSLRCRAALNSIEAKARLAAQILDAEKYCPMIDGFRLIADTAAEALARNANAPRGDR